MILVGLTTEGLPIIHWQNHGTYKSPFFLRAFGFQEEKMNQVAFPQQALYAVIFRMVSQTFIKQHKQVKDMRLWACISSGYELVEAIGCEIHWWSFANAVASVSLMNPNEGRNSYPGLWLVMWCRSQIKLRQKALSVMHMISIQGRKFFSDEIYLMLFVPIVCVPISC